jgi:hypothetical protein
MTMVTLCKRKGGYWLVCTIACRQYAFRISKEVRDGLRLVHARDGIPEVDQIHQAIKAWLERKGVKLKSIPRRTKVRRRGRTVNDAG